MLRRPLHRIGLFFSAVALVFLTVVLPFHRHSDEDASKASSQTHCSVCHFSKNATPTLSNAEAIKTPVFFPIILEEISFHILSSQSFSVCAPPRAPPLSAT